MDCHVEEQDNVSPTPRRRGRVMSERQGGFGTVPRVGSEQEAKAWHEELSGQDGARVGPPDML